MKFIVTIKDAALMSLVYTTIEFFEVGNGNGENELETGGFLWGSSTLTKSEGKSIRHIVIETSTNEVLAERSKGSFSPSIETLKLMSRISHKSFPHYSFLGMFHSHPYRLKSPNKKGVSKPYTESDVVQGRLFELSREKSKPDDYLDYDWFNDHKSILRDAGYKLEIVTTICKRKLRADRASFAYNHCTGLIDRKSIRHVVQFDVGPFRIWINATVARKSNRKFYLDNQGSTNTFLNIPYIMGGMRSYDSWLGI